MSVQCHACIGGTNIGEDIRKLDYGQHIVSGTPGRVFGKLPYSACLHAGVHFLFNDNFFISNDLETQKF